MTTTMAIWVLLSGAAVAILGHWAGQRRGRAAGEAAATKALEQQLQDAKTQLALAEQSISHHQEAKESQHQDMERLRSELQQQAQAHRGEMKNLSQDLLSAKNKAAELETANAKDLEAFASERRQFGEMRERLAQEFQNLANKIFEEKQATFDSRSRESLSSIIQPFRQQLDTFRQRIDQVHTESVQGQATLKGELGRLQLLNQQITQEASNLAKALKGDKKLQGNWGEQKVELLLEQAGLRKGIEYERERNFKDDDGNNCRPDFVVKLPEGKHIIIDSKVSLVDYSAYIAADAPEDRQRRLAAHVAAIRAHIKELSNKRYPELMNIESPDFTFLFVAIEPAYLAAVEHAPSLFQEAYDERIALVTATTLLPVLRVAANLWSQQRRSKSTQELAEQAGRVYDKLRIFIERMDKLGSQLESAQKTYKDSMDTLRDGRGSLVRAAEKFQDLGVKIAKKLPLSVQAADEGHGGP